MKCQLVRPDAWKRLSPAETRQFIERIGLSDSLMNDWGRLEGYVRGIRWHDIRNCGCVCVAVAITVARVLRVKLVNRWACMKLRLSLTLADRPEERSRSISRSRCF